MPPAQIETQFTSLPPGKLRCYVTGTLRKETPEEHVRQRVARSLVEEYGYAKSDLQLERIIYLGVRKVRADIVIFEPGSAHVHENIFAIVEAKRESIKPTHADQGIDQLNGYLAGTPNAEYGMWIGSEVRAYQRETVQGKVKITQITDLPMAGGKVAAPTSFAGLVPATEALKDVFRRCHNYISANQGGSKEFAFHEFLKVTFCKVFDERMSTEPRFFVMPSETRTAQGQAAVLERVSEIFSEVCDHYGYIFGEEDVIHLRPQIITYIVAELQKFTLLDTEFDYKGQAYEQIVGANSRGERGEFFTPRNLCALAVEMIMSLVPTDRLVTSKILDPACGTGGFLRTYVHELNKVLQARESAKWGPGEKARDRARTALRNVCDQGVLGIDFNPVLVRAAQMNLVMHGDGSSNVFHQNALLSWGEWEENARNRLADGSIDIIVTNPPFGEDLIVDDSHVLAQYGLTTFGVKAARSSMAPQELFIERCYRLLKPNGLAAIVTPDNILSNPSYSFMREWIVLHYTVIASVWLPGEMFQPSTGTQTSLLILKKRPKPLKSLEDLMALKGGEPVFLSVPKRIGHDQRGSFVAKRDEDGDVVVKQFNRKRYLRDPAGGWSEEVYSVEEPVSNDDLPEVAVDFKKWLTEAGAAYV